MDEKKELLLKILERVKDKHESLLSIYTILNAGMIVTEDWLDTVYDALMDLVKQGDDKKMARGMENIKKSASALEKMREKEASERANEDADSLLDII